MKKRSLFVAIVFALNALSASATINTELNTSNLVCHTESEKTLAQRFPFLTIASFYAARKHFYNSMLQSQSDKNVVAPLTVDMDIMNYFSFLILAPFSLTANYTVGKQLEAATVLGSGSFVAAKQDNLFKDRQMHPLVLGAATIPLDGMLRTASLESAKSLTNGTALEPYQKTLGNTASAALFGGGTLIYCLLEGSFNEKTITGNLGEALAYRTLYVVFDSAEYGFSDTLKAVFGDKVWIQTVAHTATSTVLAVSAASAKALESAMLVLSAPGKDKVASTLANKFAVLLPRFVKPSMVSTFAQESGLISGYEFSMATTSAIKAVAPERAEWVNNAIALGTLAMLKPAKNRKWLADKLPAPGQQFFMGIAIGSFLNFYSSLLSLKESDLHKMYSRFFGRF